MQSRSRMITVCSIMTAIGLILGYIESFIVIPIRIPGIRLGLANIVTVLTLYLCGPMYALAVQLIRITLSALLFGSPITFLYGLCGSILAFAAMVILKRYDFSIIGVSVGGAVFHNTGQIVAAYFMIMNPYVFYYIPALSIAAVAAGLIVGALSKGLLNRLDHYGKGSI